MVELFPPADLMVEILLRLPVTSLLRFRCVCKGWRDLIDSRSFAKSHFNNLSNKPPSLLILRHELNSINAYNSYDIVDLSSVINGGPDLAVEEHPFPADGESAHYVVRGPDLAFKEHPFPADGESAHYVGQCNGLVCLSYWSDPASLWNPVTRKQFVFELPPQELSPDLGWFHRWGFGYDKDSDDYKVVAVGDAVELAYMVWIYSLRSRSWKRIDDFPYWFEDPEDSGVFVNGALHWKVYQVQGESEVPVIGALHLGKLEYNLVLLPEYNSENTVADFMYFGVLDGRLYAVYYVGDYLDLWTMNEYGVRESWTKLMRCFNYWMGLRSLAYLQNDEVLTFTQYFDDESVGCEFRKISFGRRSCGRTYEINLRSSETLSHEYYSYVYVSSLVCPQNGW